MPHLTDVFAIDFGSTALRLARPPGDGTVLRVPSRVLLDGTGQVRAVGRAALAVESRTPPELTVEHPIRAGEIADLVLASMLLRELLRTAGGRRPWRYALVCSPAGYSDLARRSVRAVCHRAGLSGIRLIPRALAAAVGAGLPVDSPRGTLAVDLGSGSSSASLLGSGHVLASRTVRFGGDELDAMLARHAREHLNLTISTGRARRIRAALGTPQDGEVIRVHGQDPVLGFPRAVDLPARQLADLLLGATVRTLGGLITSVLEDCSAELHQDVVAQGLLLYGPEARLPGLAHALTTELGLPVRTADDPAATAVRGAARLLEGPGHLRGLAKSRRADDEDVMLALARPVPLEV